MMTYLHQPREVSIETLALCNASCTFCPYTTLDRKGLKMSDETIAHLIEQMTHWTIPFSIAPFKVNEPFLDKRFLHICRQINQYLPLAQLRIFTNGSRFTHDNAQEVLALKNVAHVWVSLNDVEPDRYKALMGLNLNHVADKIDIFHKEWLRAVKGRFILSRVCEVNPDVEYVRATQFNQYVLKRWPGALPFHIKRDGWISFTKPQSNLIPSTPCARWEELSIMADGRVALCCMDGTGEYSIGDVHTHSLLDIYNQPQLLERRMRSVKRSHVNPCNRCTY